MLIVKASGVSVGMRLLARAVKMACAAGNDLDADWCHQHHAPVTPRQMRFIPADAMDLTELRPVISRFMA